jgi:DNA-binding Xre family transcriptional regulator
MIHRHLDVQPATPPEELPSVALVDLLERGDLGDWQALAAAVAHSPYGPLAERLLRLVDAHPMYGTSPLWRAFIDRCRARAEGGRGRLRETGLAELRREQGLSQAQVADRAGMSQSDLSKLERRRDARLSTLRTWVGALGGRLRLLIEIDDEQLEARFPDCE